MLDLKKLDQASKMGARWLVTNCQVSEESNADFGAFMEADPATRSLRVPLDPWLTAAAVRSLLMVHGRTRHAQWKEAAICGGDYLETLQCSEEMEETGALWAPWIRGSDALRVDANYRSIAALLDLYGATGSSHYLESARGIGEWFSESVYRGGGTHLNRYFPDKRTYGWPRSHILDEGGFMRLRDLTRDEIYDGITGDQIEALTDASTEQGIFSCMKASRMEREDDLDPESVSMRGMYWHLSPIVLAYEKDKQDRFLELAERGVRLVMDSQTEEGYLNRALFPQTQEASGPDGLATAMFATLWTKMYELNGNSAYRKSAEMAIDWMIGSQSVSRRDSLGAFYDGKRSNDGELRDTWTTMSTIYGIMACEEYLRI